MNVTLFEKLENNTARLNVEVEASVFNAAVDAVFKSQARGITVPGFRRGKAPRRIIENLYGKNVFYSDALDEVAPAAWAFASNEREERMVGYPQIDGVTVDEDLTAHFTFIADLYPEVTLGAYKGLSAPRPLVEVPDSELDAEINAIANRNARVESVDRPAQDGDTTIINFDGYLDGVAFDGGHGEDHELILGSNSFIVGFEAGIVGMSVGDERDLDLTFPEAYHSDELAGKAVVFHVKVNEIKSKILPELDDEFAKDVSEFDTYAEYRADLRRQFEDEKSKEADKSFENALLDKVADNMTVVIPESMVTEQIDRHLQQMSAELAQYGLSVEQYFGMSGLNESQARAQMRPNAEKQTRVTVALETIAEAEGFNPTDEEVEALYTETAEKFGAELSEIKESVERESVVHDLKIRAAIKLIRESATATAPEEHDHDHDHDGHDHDHHDHDHDHHDHDGHDHDHDHEEKPKPKSRAKKAAASTEAVSDDKEATAEKAPAKPKAAPKTPKAAKPAATTAEKPAAKTEAKPEEPAAEAQEKPKPKSRAKKPPVAE